MNTAPSNGGDPNGTPLPMAMAGRAHGLTVRADVLVLLPDPKSARACLEIAEDAARAIGGILAAAHVGADPDAMIAAPEEIDVQRLRELEEGPSLERLERVARTFEAWRQERPDREEVPLDDCRGDLASCVRSECLRSDLVVTPAHGNMDARDVFHDVLFNEGKLVLVPPAEGYAGNFLRHVVIGWKPHAHAEGAVLAARPWLLAAERLTVVCIDDTANSRNQTTARDMLARLDLIGEVVAIRSDRRPVGQTLGDYAVAVQASCLLIGAYRHSYLMELLFGRVTRYLLAHARLPLMMKH
ncbi:universal stress protein [Sinorhizobium alkalisoli]|uniref:Universal stress protein UspA n=1 Tax=Sinorhizobium alkalisoli TaxID=1752398 RepID=A0A1E3V7U5_9HYPH|nr:universal stress protein [Sinorhizobium alkalisoli]MCG5481233.1 universal stress protein [Sinorhizobium alkalisoli]ODR89678.1 universal stress protein UspA [Sinorhizobium alkalisoli]